MKLLDLFTGTGSVARVAESLGYDVTSLDADARCNPDIRADINSFDYTVWSPGEFDIVWASPPCDTFSAARRSNLGRVVKGELMTPETLLRDAENIGVPILRRTQEIIEYLQPKKWFIENPHNSIIIIGEKRREEKRRKRRDIPPRIHLCQNVELENSKVFKPKS